MRVRHSTRNLVDNICFFGVLIVVPCALLLYHSAATIVDTPQYQAVLSSIHEHGAAAAFSGPLVRGDVATVRSHLAALQATPQAREAYVSLARAAIVANRA